MVAVFQRKAEESFRVHHFSISDCQRYPTLHFHSTHSNLWIPCRLVFASRHLHEGLLFHYHYVIAGSITNTIDQFHNAWNCDEPVVLPGPNGMSVKFAHTMKIDCVTFCRS